MVALLKTPAQSTTEFWSSGGVSSQPSTSEQDAWANRRVFPRKEVNLAVQGRRLDHTIEARQLPRLSFQLRDLSLGGLSALSDLPLSSGEHVSVTFPPSGKARGWDAFGRVLRCEASGMGYRVAVEFDPLPAA